MAFALISMQLMGKIQWSGRSLTLLDPTYASKYIPIIASVSEHQPTTWYTHTHYLSYRSTPTTLTHLPLLDRILSHPFSLSSPLSHPCSLPYLAMSTPPTGRRFSLICTFWCPWRLWASSSCSPTSQTVRERPPSLPYPLPFSPLYHVLTLTWPLRHVH